MTRNMKKVISAFLLFAILFAFAACGAEYYITKKDVLTRVAFTVSDTFTNFSARQRRVSPSVPV